MLPSLCPPVKPFHPAYPQAWFMQLDVILALNGITAQPMMHAVLLQALPVELHHLAAATTSSPRPYDNLCAAVLARYGETYRPLPGTREFQVSPPTRAVPPGPQPSLDQDLTSPAMTPSTSRQATSASIPAPDHPPDEVQEVPAAIGHSTESSVFSTASAHGPSDVPASCTSSPTSMAHDTSATSGSTTATSPHALESAIDRDIVTPAIRPPIAEASPVMMSDEPVFPSTSTLCASCQQRPASPSQSLAAEVPAPNHRWQNFRDAATMADAPEDDVPGQHTPELTAYATPATEADIQQADLRTSPLEPTTVGASTSTGSPSEHAAETTPAQLHHRFPAEPLTQDTIHPASDRYAGALVAAATTPNRHTCLPHATLRRRSHRARRQTQQKLHTRPSTLPRGAAISLKGIYALRRHPFVRRHVTDTHLRRTAPPLYGPVDNAAPTTATSAPALNCICGHVSQPRSLATTGALPKGPIKSPWDPPGYDHSAAAVPCNPLYFCIPVTVAASTTLLLPTTSFAMAYVYDRLDIGPWDLVFCGLVLKLVSILVTILTVSTLGNFIFHWNRIPVWFSLPLTHNNTNSVMGHQQG
ncbi:hypothetical protein HPB52_022190 [Rhipicephalus sanguineus]|uniref:Uncharacterized protein n=1 Tax=Rhipicephalus sanguineus TaxID=34632 RepID=A0A9D4SWT0_RHISA|nr:hypothetical protein HPB52_022190 [Rhipicephalus sanguineus]